MQTDDIFESAKAAEYGEPLFQYSSNSANTNVDNMLASILSKFDTTYINDVIDNSIMIKFRLFNQGLPNMVYAYEQQFISLSDGFSSNKDDIQQTRFDTYINIINKLCNAYNLQFNQSDSTDYYSAAFYLYDFLVSNFTSKMISFFTNYLIREKDSIYNALGLASIKKNESYLSYSMQLFASEKLGMIHGNIRRVLEEIQTFDIDLYSILELCYEPNIARYINSIISDRGNFFRDQYLLYIVDSDYGPQLQQQIRLSIQSCGRDLQDE